jgi:ubiquinone biosynthesis protein Coq4
MRLKFMLFLYNGSSKLYAQVFKRNKKAWGLSVNDFLRYPENSLGYALGEFYRSKGFDIMPKLENHDVFHVITQTNTEIEDEVAMQYLLMGNGKRSLYMYAMITIGTFIYPEFIRYYMFSYQKGKSLSTFHHIEFKDYLARPLIEIQHMLYTQTTFQTI